jgi:hypothetical protein
VWFFLVVCTVVGTALMGGKIRKELGEGGEGVADSSSSAELMPLSAGRSGTGYQAVRTSEPDRLP